MSESLARTDGTRADTTTADYGIDVLLAAQLSDRPGYDVWAGEARLALAVVEDAIQTVRVARGVATPRGRRLAAEAWAWIASHDTTQPFAFENLCDYLGLNAAWLRNGLRLGGYGTDGFAIATPRGARTERRRTRASALRTRARA